MGGAQRYPSIAACKDDGFREGLNPSYELLRATAFRGISSFSSPLPPRAQRVAGRGRGWGVLRQPHWRKDSRKDPPPPTPPHRFAEGGEKSAPAKLRHAARHEAADIQTQG